MSASSGVVVTAEAELHRLAARAAGRGPRPPPGAGGGRAPAPHGEQGAAPPQPRGTHGHPEVPAVAHGDAATVEQNLHVAELVRAGLYARPEGPGDAALRHARDGYARARTGGSVAVP